MSAAVHTNRLAQETSPYLLQHAHNPVDWNPWGEEALELARREDRPIFLSVGYSTCYWCHVMERQCFENETIAAEMNRLFVNIKVDREERPDIDQLYMTALQILTRQGGWPMSVFLTPDLRPFFAGTYFPPQDSYGRPGFPKVLAAIEDAYRNRRDDVNASADQVVAILRQMSRPRRPGAAMKIDRKWIKDLIDRGAADFDQQNGGFGTAPKFPQQTLLELMLAYLRGSPDAKLMSIIGKSLDAMAYGGIRDHLGGAFHRYSTDARWLVPHFEIMLYDNAMLLWIYAEAHRQTGEARYAAVARGIADFVLAEMTAPSGGFFTAIDAEVDGREGANYLWTRQEAVDALVGYAEAARFLRVYGLEDGPNFGDPHHGNGMPDQNVLYLAEPDDGLALLDKRLEQPRRILRDVRNQRKQPMLDRKILTSWNALMIRGLAHGGAVLREERYVSAAQNAADFLLANHRDPEGGLFRVSTGGAAKHRGFLDDYAFLIQALLALPGTQRRRQAAELAGIMATRFGARPDGGFFYTDERATDLIVRQMIGSDSPLPSGNGVAAMGLLKLGQWEQASWTIAEFVGQMESVGEGMGALAEAALIYVSQRGELKIAAGTDRDGPRSPAELAAEVVEIEPEWQGPTVLRVKCRVAEGFHLNAYDAGVAATRVYVPGVDVESVQYPEGDLTAKFEIVVRLKSAVKAGFELAMSYQACDASACLPIVSRRVKVLP
jgi:uncharacterized protein YyaL (SSP411 family)